MNKHFWFLLPLCSLAMYCASSQNDRGSDTPCTLNLSQELQQNVELSDALRFGYTRKDTDPKKVYLVAIGKVDKSGEQLQDIGMLEAMRLAYDLDCLLAEPENKFFIATRVSLRDNLDHLKSVKSRLGVNPDTIMALALMDSTESLSRLYLGGGEHTVRIIDID